MGSGRLYVPSENVVWIAVQRKPGSSPPPLLLLLPRLVPQNPRLLDDVSFHPCVRFKRWESERILSFIPPDGNFRLLSYHVSAQK